MEIGKLYSITLRNSNENYKGIIQNIGKEWILLYRLFTDYMMDGYVLLKKEYIHEFIRDDAICFTEEVLKAKGIAFIQPNNDIPLNDTYTLFEWLSNKRIVFMFSLKEDNIGYVGMISKILSKSFYLQVFDVDGHWWDKKLIYRIGTVRRIDFNTDYIESLLAYNKVKY